MTQPPERAGCAVFSAPHFHYFWRPPDGALGLCSPGQRFCLLLPRVPPSGLFVSCAQLCATPWTVARQAPLSMGFSRQDYWSGLPFSPPNRSSDPGIKPESPALQADSLLWSCQGSLWQPLAGVKGPRGELSPFGPGALAAQSLGSQQRQNQLYPSQGLLEMPREEASSAEQR